MTRRFILACALSAAFVAGAAWAAGVVVHVDAATQSRLGVATAPLAGASRAASVAGFAKVLDPIPLATLDADIAAAAAAAQASDAEAKRTKALFAADQAVAGKVAEAAAVQAKSDALKLTLLRRRIGLEWGAGIAGLSDARRGALVAALAGGRSALIRIDTPSGVGQNGLKTAELDLGAAGSARAVVIGPVRTAEPGLLSPGLLARVDGPRAAALSTGLIAPVKLTVARPVSGVIVPRAALLRTDGQTWAYVRKSATDFERRSVEGGTADAAGLFVTAGFTAGEAVVVVGASALFAAEHAEPAKAGG